MEGFFGGTVIILYFLSHYAAEYIFVACCCLPAVCGALGMLFLRLGGAGGMLAAWSRSKAYRRAGIVAPRERARFFTRCVKGTSPAFRASYALFLEGRLSSAALAAAGVRSASRRRGTLPLGVAGVGVISSLLVFLSFYFRVPIGETLLRTAIAAFHGAVSAVSYLFLSYEYVARAEKAAERFVASLDGLLLRDKEGAKGSFSFVGDREEPVSAPRAEGREFDLAESERTDDPCRRAGLTEEERADDKTLSDLKALLRDLDFPPRA